LLSKAYRIQQWWSQMKTDMENLNDLEYDFRKRYAAELQKMTDRRLTDERIQVNQQAMRTPERRGETIKREEIAKEIIRRVQTKWR
jgi:anion-transporting  ArsA/GET3 family ATPase